MNPETLRLFLGAVIRTARDSKMPDDQIALELNIAASALLPPAEYQQIIISTDTTTIIAPLGPDTFREI